MSGMFFLGHSVDHFSWGCDRKQHNLLHSSHTQKHWRCRWTICLF